MVFCNLGLVHKKTRLNRHNPYFNRWFSAIENQEVNFTVEKEVTILILIDGFLQ